MNLEKAIQKIVFLGIGLCAILFLLLPLNVAAQGLPFTENFSDTSLKDTLATHAEWSTAEQKAYLAFQKARYNAMSDPVVWDIGSEIFESKAIALGDVDGDGDLDVVVGNRNQVNKLYLNNGSSVPFIAETGKDIGTILGDTKAIALGDMDGDGDLDVVVGEWGGSVLYLNNGTSDPFSGAEIKSTGGRQYVTDIAIGDVNEDGYLDVVTANSSGGANILCLNNGTSDPFNEVTGVEISPDTGSTNAITLNDMNGDGNLDVIAGNYNASLRLYLGNGNGTFATGVDIDASSNTAALITGDVDNDGDMDLIRYLSTWVLGLYLNNGSSDPFNSVSMIEIETNVANLRMISLGDIDNDGDLDLLAGLNGDLNWLYLNTGSSVPFDSATKLSISTDTDKTEAVALGDVDGDGDLDLVTAINGLVDEMPVGPPNKLYINNASKNPFQDTSANLVGADNEYTLNLALGDVDNDGDIDVLATNYSGYDSLQTSKMCLNNGDGTFANGYNVGPAESYTSAIQLGDVDNDGDLDAVIGNFAHRNKLYLNNGSDFPFHDLGGVPLTDIGTTDNATRAIALGDVDNDGDIDIVEGVAFSDSNKLYLNNGTTNPFSGVSSTDIGTDTPNTIAIALGDINQDGYLDVIAGIWGEANRLYLNNGTAAPFNDVVSSSIGTSTRTIAIALADVNGDGLLDFAASDDYSNVDLFLNNGTADPFAGVTSTPVVNDTGNVGTTSAIVFADVDGDGDLDALLGNRDADKQSRLYLNNGTADPFNSVTAANIGSDTDHTAAMAVGDMDNDGHPDIVIGNGYWNIENQGFEEPNKLYLNLGAPYVFGHLTATAIGPDTDNTEAVAIGDVDNDGDLDLATGNDGQTNKLYLNNHTDAPFLGASTLIAGTEADNTYDIILADMNGDGKPDLLAANNGQLDRLYLNDGDDDPFDTLAGTPIGNYDLNATPQLGLSHAIEIADINGDGLLDVVVGLYYIAVGIMDPEYPNRLFLNDGAGDPFDTTTPINIGATRVTVNATNTIAIGDINHDGNPDVIEGHTTGGRVYFNEGDSSPFDSNTAENFGTDEDIHSLAIGDVNGDGNLDIVTGVYGQTNKLYLNTGDGSPTWLASGVGIGSETENTQALTLSDIDQDGDLDVIAWNWNQDDRLYLNNGTADPFNGVTPVSIVPHSQDPNNPLAGIAADFTGNGSIDLVVGNSSSQQNKLYRQLKYTTHQGRVASAEVDDETVNNISNATLSVIDEQPVHTDIDYFMSNNGGQKFFQVRPDQQFLFPTLGSDLRWKAELNSLSPFLTPTLSQVDITNVNIAPEVIAGGTLNYTEDDPATPVDPALSVTDIDNINLTVATIAISSGYQTGEDVLGFVNANGITGSWNSTGGVLTLSGSSSVGNYQAALRSVTYINSSDNPAETNRTLEFVVSDGVASSDTVTSTVTVTRTNDPPVITAHAPASIVSILQNQTTPISVNGGTPPTGSIYLTAQDPDNTVGSLSLIIQGGDNYFVQGSSITPVQDFYSGPDLLVNVLLYDGTDYSAVYPISIHVNDEVPPSVVSITRANTNPTNATSVYFNITFSESVSDVTAGDFSLARTGTISSGSVSQPSGSGSSYTIEVTGYSGDGTLGLNLVDDNSIVDASSNPLGGAGSGDGNFTGSVYDIDRVPPYVTAITRADTNPTNASAVDFTVSFSEPVFGVNTNDFSLPPRNEVINPSILSVSGIDGDDNYTVTVNNYSGEGDLYLDLIDDDSISDTLGNLLGTSSGPGVGTFTSGENYTIDVVSPFVLSIIRSDSNPTNADSVSFTVTFSEVVSGVDIGDFSLTKTVTAGFVTGIDPLTPSDVYTLTASGYSGEGTLQLVLADNDTIRDTLNNLLGGVGSGNGDFTGGQSYNIDMIAPTVDSIAVQSNGTSVDVVFSEPMGTGAMTAINYTLSGSGQGSLTNAPTGVSDRGGTTYRLTWSSGEMIHGGDITITVSQTEVLDIAGTPLGSSNTATEVGGAIGISPTTTASITGATYDSTQNVSLTCSDNSSGCAATYFSIDGNDPNEGDEADLYSGQVLAITEDTVLKFYSVDNAGNTETVQTEIYTINIPTTISCISSDSDITFGEGFTISGSIDNDPPNNPNQGISIELMPPLGDSIFLSTNADENGDFSLEVACDVITGAGDWTVQTSWPGDASHLGSDSPLVSLTVSQAATDLTLDVVAAESIKVNSRPPIGGDFSPLPLCSSMDLSGTTITIFASEPDGGPIHELNATTNQYGQFLLNFDTAEAGQPFDFDVVGEWTISAEYSTTTEIAGAVTDDVIIRVVPTAGYAILVQGRVQSGEGMPSHHKTASFVYDKLKDRQLLDDDIQYLSWLYSDGWDGDPSKTNIQDALTVWARDKMDPDFVHPIAELDTQGQAGDLYIIMIDHGWTDPLDDEEGIFYIYPDDPLTSTELGGWLSELQTNLAGTVSADRNIVVILGFCRAGAFIEDLSDPAHDNRVIVASAAKDESSHRGPQDVDENGQPLRDGEYFVSEFFKSVSYGKSIKQCFEDATLLTESFTSSGSGVTNAPFYDDSIQHPLLNDNGDVVGSNELSSVTGEDGAVSEFLFIGASPPEGNDPGDVLITRVNPAQFLGTTDTTADLWAEVDDPNDLRLIWMEIKQPNYNPVDPGAGLQIEMDNFKKATTDVTNTRYTWTNVGDSPDPVDLFDIPGTYQVFYFAKDNDTGHVSPLIQSRIYKALDGNTPPNTFSLLTPADLSTVLTTTILDWEDTIDPDGDSLTYSVLLSKGDDQFTDPILIEGLSNSDVLISAEDGIQDLSTYYWKVQAIDEYGAYRETSVRIFETDNTNPVIGFIKGFVYDATTDEAITSATININNGSLILNSSLNGHYLGSFEPGNFPITVTAGGYQDIQSTLDMPEGITVTMNFGLTPSIVDTDPVATISSPATSVVIDEGDTVNFQGSVANGNAPFTYDWDFDSGATNSSVQDPGNVLFNTPGTFTVTFTVTDNDGGFDSDTVTVTVNEVVIDLLPTATIDAPASPPSILSGNSVNFQGSVASGDEPFTYAWDFDGGATNSTLEDPGDILFAMPGTYAVRFTVTDNDGDTDDDTVTVTVVDLIPTATIETPVSPPSILAGESVNFQGSVTSGDPAFTYVWDFGGGATNSTQEDPGNTTFGTPGTYTVTFTVTDNDGDVDSDSVNVTVTDSDLCPTDPEKTDPGLCGCGTPDTDTDDDTTPDCNDTDDDNDGILDVDDDFPLDDSESLDTDGDGTGDNADTDDDNDGISDATESSGPNFGDANNDGIQDALQNNVACLESYTTQGYVILETPDGITLSNCQTADNPSPGDAPVDMEFDFGFYDFTISGIVPGGSTTLTMTLPDNESPDTYYKYGMTPDNQTDHWYEFLYDAETGAEIDGNVITLYFVDALRGDDVLTQDSMIIDLGAPGFDATAVDLEPTATITSPASNTTITTGGSVNFQGSVTSGNSPFTYSWDFGGGATNVTTQNPGNVVFSSVGTYTVTFTVTDANSDVDSDSVIITVSTPPDDGGDDGGGGGGGGGGGCFVNTLVFD